MLLLDRCEYGIMLMDTYACTIGPLCFQATEVTILTPPPPPPTHTLSRWPCVGRSRGGWQEFRTPPPSLKNHKNTGFLSNTGPDPLKIHKATKPAFNVGPPSPVKHHLNGVSLVD